MANPTVLAVREAAKTILDTISGIGEVTVYQNQAPPWQRSEGGLGDAFWEISIGAVVQRPYAAPRYMERRPLLVIQGWLQWNSAEGSEDRWDSLWLGVLNAIEDERTLGGVVDDDTGLPQMLANDVRTFRDKDSDKPCHFCQIQLDVACDFTYAAP